MDATPEMVASDPIAQAVREALLAASGPTSNVPAMKLSETEKSIHGSLCGQLRATSVLNESPGVNSRRK